MKKLEEALEEAERQPELSWDPPDHERFWLAHVQTGEKGWLVRRLGRTCVKLNRPSCDTTNPYHESLWKPDVTHRPLNKMQITRVAFEADRQLLYELGERVKSRKEWKTLGEHQRRSWMEQGPVRPELRAKLYGLITSLLGDVKVIR